MGDNGRQAMQNLKASHSPPVEGTERQRRGGSSSSFCTLDHLTLMFQEPRFNAKKTSNNDARLNLGTNSVFWELIQIPRKETKETCAMEPTCTVNIVKGDDCSTVVL